MKRFILDTDVIIAALRSPTGASSRLLYLASTGKIIMLVSVALFVEYEAKCSMQEHYKAGGLTKAQAELYIAGLAKIAKPVKIHYRWRPVLSDPDDEMVLEAAVNGQADAIITFNQKDFTNIEKQFNVKVLTPRDALRSAV